MKLFIICTFIFGSILFANQAFGQNQTSAGEHNTAVTVEFAADGENSQKVTATQVAPGTYTFSDNVAKIDMYQAASDDCTEDCIDLYLGSITLDDTHHTVSINWSKTLLIFKDKNGKQIFAKKKNFTSKMFK